MSATPFRDPGDPTLSASNTQAPPRIAIQAALLRFRAARLAEADALVCLMSALAGLDHVHIATRSQATRSQYQVFRVWWMRWFAH